MADETQPDGGADGGTAGRGLGELREAVPRTVDMEEIRGRVVLEAPQAWQFSGDQSPVHLDYVARLRGHATPSLSEPFTYCELGCRNGVTSNILAAALPHGRFVAIGNNPEQLANARRIAESAGLENITFLESAIDQPSEEDLPAFDFITLQGVYSHAGGPGRQRIVQFIADRLKPNGLVYVGYNAMPGWAPFLPLRQLTVAYAGMAPGGPLPKAERALRTLKFLRDNDCGFFELNPLTGRFLDDLVEMDPAVVLHEFLSESWQPLHVSQVAGEMSLAQAAYCGSADVGSNYSDVAVPEEFWPLLDSADNEIHRETHKALILNQMYRRDVFSKADPDQAAEDRGALFGEVVFGARLPESKIAREVPLGRRMIQYGAKIYDELIPAVAGGTRTVDELCALPALKEHGRDVILTALHRLAVGGQIRPFAGKALEADKMPKRFRIAHGLNRILLSERLLRDPSCVLASPVLGSGVAIDLTQGLLLLAGDEVGPDKMVERAVELLAESGQPFQKEGVVIDDPNQARDVLAAKLDEFTETWGPLMLRFGIIEPA